MTMKRLRACIIFEEHISMIRAHSNQSDSGDFNFGKTL